MKRSVIQRPMQRMSTERTRAIYFVRPRSSRFVAPRCPGHLAPEGKRTDEPRSLDLEQRYHLRYQALLFRVVGPGNDKSLSGYSPVRPVVASLFPVGGMAPRPGLEPGTYGLTVRRSTN